MQHLFVVWIGALLQKLWPAASASASKASIGWGRTKLLNRTSQA
jgi:hypothetical protein